MANSNLFEKYGIKEVADVTFYRIERKDETYESQREIAVSSILKSAVELKTVYPIENGIGSEEGFEAYVFTDAVIVKGRNYNCDDTITVKEVYTVTLEEVDEDAFSEAALESFDYDTAKGGTAMLINAENNKQMTEGQLSKYNAGTPELISAKVLGTPIESTNEDDETVYTVTILASYSVEYSNADEVATDLDETVIPGTHEFSYEEQILMNFAKNQNLINKTGVRYQFANADGIFGDFMFNDNFAAAPKSSEKVVVLGFVGKFNEVDYDIEEIQNGIKDLTETYSAKAYDVTYTDYVELVVEDEMGYYRPECLGSTYNGSKKGNSIAMFDDADAYVEWAEKEKGVDYALANAKMWGENTHESINDAIDALRQEKLLLDTGAENKLSGINSVYGGYKVQSKVPAKPEVNDLVDGNEYDIAGKSSNYSLVDVLEKLALVASTDESVIGTDLKITASGEYSNRAIYVKVDGLVDTAAGAYIYLLTNKNAKKIANDKDGIFWFNDKKGNKVYYQDRVFAGTEHLALVIIGDKGLIFVVNRFGNKNTEKVAWMVNENGYITNSQAKMLVKNGLIHTVDVTVNDETFEATCTVGGIKIHKTTKKVNRYVPVLFLDTLKVSTLEMTAETTSAKGGKGNAELIIWDYGKEITLTLQDALYTPASMSAMIGTYEGNDFTKGVKDTKRIDRTEKCVAKRSFIVPAGNSKGCPSEGDLTAQAVYIDLATMEPYQDGAPIAEGEVYLKWTRSIAYGDNSLGNTIEISADKFPGTYKIVGDTFARNKTTGEDQRFQFVIPQAKMTSGETITLEAEGDPTVFDMNLKVLRPEDGIMVKLIQYDVVENEEENDGSTMVKDTENLNLLDDAEMYKVSADDVDDKTAIGATEY